MTIVRLWDALKIERPESDVGLGVEGSVEGCASVLGLTELNNDVYCVPNPCTA